MKEFLSKVVPPLVSWRIALFLIGAVTWVAFPAIHHADRFSPSQSIPSLNATADMDGEHYLEIAELGYKVPHYSAVTGVDEPSNTAFFPLFPMVLKVLGYLGINSLIASLLMNFGLTAGCCWFIWGMSRSLGLGSPSRASLALLAFPASLFLGQVYTEALFCFLTFGAFWAQTKNRPWLAGAFLAAATATRVTGIIAAGFVVIGFLMKRQWKQAAVSGIMSFIGIGLWALYLKLALGDALLFVHIHDTYWASEKLSFNVFQTLHVWELQGISYWKSAMWFEFGKWALNVGTLFLTVVAALGKWKRLPYHFTGYALAIALTHILLGTTNSLFRYSLVIFPAYLAIGAWKRPAYLAYLIAGAMLVGFLTYLFSTFLFIG